MVQVLLKSTSFAAIMVAAYLLKRVGLFKKDAYSLFSKRIRNVTLPCANSLSIAVSIVCIFTLLTVFGAL